MFRMWCKIFANNHLIQDTVIENDDPNLNRTRKVFNALDEACYQFNLSRPIWLDCTVNDFKRFDKARFTKDNFIEQVDFDYLEIHVIEED